MKQEFDALYNLMAGQQNVKYMRTFGNPHPMRWGFLCLPGGGVFGVPVGIQAESHPAITGKEGASV